MLQLGYFVPGQEHAHDELHPPEQNCQIYPCFMLRHTQICENLLGFQGKHLKSTSALESINTETTSTWPSDEARC